MLEELLIKQVKEAVKDLYQIEATDQMIQLQKTRPEFEGQITLVVFPFVKMARKAPAVVAEEIGNRLIGGKAERLIGGKAERRRG